MKKIIVYELMRKIKHKPSLMRKLKIFAVLGMIGFFVTTGLVIWAGVSAVGYVASKANQAVQSPVRSISGLQALSCWSKAQSLMAVEPWLARPALDNLHNLKVACFEKKSAACEGYECIEMKKLVHTAEGTTI